MSTYPNTHAKLENLISDVQFRGNWFGFGIIGNDFQALPSYSDSNFIGWVQKSPEFNLFIKPLDSVPANEKPQSVSIYYCVAKQQMRRYTKFFDQEGKRSADLELNQHNSI